jgi:serine/threonine protein kinase
MGVVWLAHDELLDREVAVKELALLSAIDGEEAADQVVGRAVREAQAAAQLKHPGIVTVHDVVTHGGRPWIIMELINGPSLMDVLEQDGPLTEQRAAGIGLQVLGALETAHRHGIVHRDVKPANIILDGERAVLTDFGIAAVGGASALTATGMLVGSPQYIAPERILGCDAGPVGDLWSLGVTLYVMLTGRSPFQRDGTQATIAAVLGVDPDPLPTAGRLATLISGLLCKDPGKRLSTEQATALLAAVEAGPMAPDPPSGSSSSTRTEPDPAPTVIVKRGPDRARIKDMPPGLRRWLVPVLLVVLLAAATTAWLFDRRTAAPSQAGNSLPPHASGPPTSSPLISASVTSAGTAASTAAPATTASAPSPTQARTSIQPGAASSSFSPGPAPPGFTPMDNSREGFFLDIPKSWVVDSSISWANRTGDKTGPFISVGVDHHPLSPQTSILDDLAANETSTSSLFQGYYQRVALGAMSVPRWARGAAQWEYTIGSIRPGYVSQYILKRAYLGAENEAYYLTATVDAATARAAKDAWTAAQPTLTTMLDSFQLEG